MGKKGSDGRSSKERETTSVQDTLQVTSKLTRKPKSPTPGGLRSRSATPARGRSSTPFSVYIAQRSPTPSAWRSITPFLRREEKEKTPFELGRDIKTQLICNKAVLDKALVMDISGPEDCQKPVRYITSDLSIIDRASVMDVSNVEVIYVVEEYDEEEEEEEEIEIVEEKKSRKKSKRSRRSSNEDEWELGSEDSVDVDREESIDSEEADEHTKKGKKKPSSKKKEKKEKSPSPKLTLNLEIGGGAKASKKMFESASAPKPPPKKTKLQIQLEEKAKAAAKAAEDLRIKKEKEEAAEKLRKEEEKRLQEEAEAAALAEQELENEDSDEYKDEDEDNESDLDELKEEVKVTAEEPENIANVIEVPIVENLPPKDPDSDDELIRPNLEDNERWRRLEKGEDIIVDLRRFSHVERRRHSERETDAEWQKRRLKARLPYFIIFLQDRAVPTGTKVQLSCAVAGPNEIVRWYKDDCPIERDSSYRIKNANDVFSILIFHTLEWHSGKYKCVIGNDNGLVESCCLLTVYEASPVVPTPPSFKYMREHYNSRDDELTIECQVHGVPKPKITWTLTCVELTTGYKFTVLEEPNGVCKLMLYKPTTKDNGTYVCMAKNFSGEAQASHTVEVGKHLQTHVAGIFRAGDRIQREKEIIAKKTIEAALQSKAESERKRDLAELHRKNGTLEPSIANKYKLNFARPLRNRNVMEGSTVKLICSVNGPSPTCCWLKNDKRIVLGKNIKNLTFQGKAVLELLHVNARSSGTYKCVAKNDFCEIMTICKLKVHNAKGEGEEEPPTFEEPLKDVYLANDEDLIINAKVRGNPRPNITWFKDGLPVAFNDRIVYNLHPDGLCELYINKPTTEDMGLYICMATNKLGIEKINHTILYDGMMMSRSGSISSLMGISKRDDFHKAEELTLLENQHEMWDELNYEKLDHADEPLIKDQLYFIAQLVNRYVVEGAMLKLQAIVGGSNPKFHWYKNDEPIESGEHMKIFSRHGMTILKAGKITIQDAGKYTVIARNDYMEISSSAILHVYEMEICADIAPVFIKPLKDNYTLHSNELKLETAIRGQPEPKVFWYMDGIPLEDKGRFHIFKYKEGGLELTIDKPTSNDSGKYLIRAENRAGIAEISHNVVFEGEASHIADNIHGVFHADKNLVKSKPEDQKLVTFEPTKQKKTESMPDPTPKQSLFFYASLSNRYISENSIVKFQACVGGPKPIFTWFKDGELLEHGDHIRILKRENLAILKILHVTPEDAGKYTIFVKNDFSEITSSANLHVYKVEANTDVAPVFTKPLTYHYKLHKNELCLEAGLRGQPMPEIWWYHDGTEITNGERHTLENNLNGTIQLIIEKPVFKDSGRYYIRAVNRAGTTETAHKVVFQGEESSIADNTHGVFHADKTMKKSDPDDILKKLTRVMKSAKGEEKELSSGEEEETSEEETSLLKKEKAMDPADPRRIKNIENIIPVKSRELPQEELEKQAEPQLQTFAAITNPKTPQPPLNIKQQVYFLNFLSNRTAKVGSNVQWVVNLTGPTPKARWYHNDKRITFGSSSRYSCEDGVAVLILFAVTEANTGEYKLRVIGPENEIECKCSLFVYSAAKEVTIAPTFTVGIKENYSQHDDALILDCRVRGQPRPEIKWIKGVSPIEISEKYEQVDLADGYSKLIISHPTEEDSGRYTCVATNEAGENKMLHMVDFQGPERFTIEKTLGFFHRNTNKPHLVVPLGNQTVCLGGTIALSAEFIQSISPIDVQWLHNRESLMGRSDVKIFMNRGLYTLAIMDVSFAYEGTYICRARNSFGTVDSYATADIIFSGEESENPPCFKKRPKETELKLLYGDTLTISFKIDNNLGTKLTLWKGNREITHSERVAKDFDEENEVTTFTLKSLEVTDTATYFVVARNNCGTDRIFVSVTVSYPATK